MCTLTILPYQGGGFRMGCNRDESRQRPEALPPQLRRFGDRSAVMPIDSVSDGTWIAVNDAGLVMTLLNYYPPGPPIPKRPDQASRGTIIPSLLNHASARSAATAASKLDPARYPPFRLLLGDFEEVIELQHDPRGIRERSRSPLDAQPFLFVSSGLGDEIVESPRRALFEEWFAGDPNDALATQDAFHSHVWPDRPHLSVCMSRPEARTVSYTVIELRLTEAVMSYRPVTDAGPGEAATVRLALQRHADRPAG